MTPVANGARSSPLAYQRFQTLVEESNLFTIVLREDIDLTAMDATSDDLPALEAWVYGIDARLRNALALAHARYTDMIGWTEGPFADFRTEERDAFASLFRAEGGYVADDAIAFMTHACDMPRTQAALWVARALVQMVRSGMVENCVATADWAYGPVGQKSRPDGTARSGIDDGLPY